MMIYLSQISFSLASKPKYMSTTTTTATIEQRVLGAIERYANAMFNERGFVVRVVPTTTLTKAKAKAKVKRRKNKGTRPTTAAVVVEKTNKTIPYETIPEKSMFVKAMEIRPGYVVDENQVVYNLTTLQIIGKVDSITGQLVKWPFTPPPVPCPPQP